MASISSSSNASVGSLRLAIIPCDASIHVDAVNLPLIESASLGNGLHVIADSVAEDIAYDLELLCEQPLLSEEIRVCVNDAVSMSPYVSNQSEKTDQGEYRYRLVLKTEERKLFELAYGFARIEVLIKHGGETQSFVTEDIPCLSKREGEQERIDGMLRELIDVDSDPVIDWMFVGGDSSENRYSTFEGSLRRGMSKSLSTYLQLMEAVLRTYEEHLDYFRLQGHCTIKKNFVKVPGREAKKVGNVELQWLMKNAEVLMRSSVKTGIDYRGNYYFPRYVVTEQQERSYDNQENRAVLAFLRDMIRACRTLLSGVTSGVTSAERVVSKLRGSVPEGYVLPSLLLVDSFVLRERAMLSTARRILGRAQMIMRLLQSSFGQVELSQKAFALPRYSKVFQEQKPYADIYRRMLQWVDYGDFSLEREHLALHALRMNKLYEYYVLKQLLSALYSRGFRGNSLMDNPMESVAYSCDYVKYVNETRVNTLFHLESAKQRIDLYYQPVIHGDNREENGITLHRLTGRELFREGDSFWTPDYLLMIEDIGSTEKRFVVLDAKYSKFFTQTNGCTNSESNFQKILLKYKVDIANPKLGQYVSSVWLICGREERESLWQLETSSWALVNADNCSSGLLALSPSRNPLTMLFDKIGVEDSSKLVEGVFAEAEDAPAPVVGDDYTEEDRPLEDALPSDVVTTADAIESTLSVVLHLRELMLDKDALFDTSWAQRNLRISHPIMRTSRPRGREGGKYRPIEMSGTEVFIFADWKPNSTNRLTKLVDQMEKKRKRN